MNKQKLASLISLNEIEDGASSQIDTWLELPFLKKLAVMPDVHTGYSLPIGGVALLYKVISPVAVGYDIGCGMTFYNTSIPVKHILTDKCAAQKIFDKIHKLVPTGFNVHAEPQATYAEFISYTNSNGLENKVNKKLTQSLGTLGGGNHFIEIGSNKNEELCVTIHSGSRNPGHSVGQFYMDLSKKKDTDLPEGFFHLDSEYGRAYYHDMNFMLQYALKNRVKILESVLEIMNLPMSLSNQFINENHNHAILTDDGVLHRKGATAAEEGKPGVIPGNMRDGVYITEGLGNDHYLSSASHGAGRKGSRNWARKEFSLTSFKDSMKDVVGTVNEHTLDECPSAYKDFDYVISCQKGKVVDIVDFIKPLINIKG